MSHIDRITSNVKSPDGGEYSVNLGKYTILIGDNEAGKSAIAESLQLARTGSAYGLLYRDRPVRDGSLLAALVPPGVDECVARGEVEGEYLYSWSLRRGKRPTHVARNGVEKPDPKDVLTVAQVRAVMGGSADTQVKFFWEHLCEPIVGADLLNMVPAELQETLVLVCPMDGSPVSLVDVLDKIGKYQREMSNTAKAGLIALESLGSVEAVTDDELAGVWDTIHRATLRDVLKELYMEYKANPTLQAGPVLRHLTEMLGGKEAIQRIPLRDDAAGALASALLNQRLSRAAVAAKNGEVRALGLRESLKTLKNVIVSLMLGNIHQAAGEFIKRVSRFLPKEESIHFFVEMSQKSISIGLKRGEKKHTALSGSAEARLLAAICAALSDQNDLIVVDDRMWDADTLKKTMTVLEKAPCQVVVMSTIKPKGRKRGAWTYVTVSRTDSEPLGVEYE
jgi:hypothetical protein